MTTEGHLNDEKKACIQCDALLDVSSRFCGNCGAKQTQLDARWVENRWALLKESAIFYAIILTICILSKFVKAFETLTYVLLFEALSWVVTVYFFAKDWHTNKYVLKWPQFSLPKLFAYCAIAISSSFLINYLVKLLNVVIFTKDEQYFQLLRGNPLAEIIVIFLVAVTPAFFEELGFRGYLLQNLLKIADKQQAIYISAFLFAIIHLNFLSLFWLIPFGLLLGAARVKEDTVWYGMLFHFCFNLTSCLIGFSK